MEDYRLTRTGDAPLAFRGEAIAEEAGKWQDGRDRNRWINLRLYRTEGGQYVLERIYETMWQGESDHHEAILLGTEPRAVVDALTSWDPASLSAIGYPPGEQWEERQTRMLDALRSLYRDRLSAILAELPGAEERIK